MTARGFTLLELLVVVTVIAVLAALLLPALHGARLQAGRAVCGEQLRGLGVGLKAYLSEDNDVLPLAAEMPSVNIGLPSLRQVLSADVSKPEAWRCNADKLGYQRSDGIWCESYWLGEGLSYEYNMGLGGRKVERWFLHPLLADHGTYVLIDFDSFHGARGSSVAKNVLYYDGHIGTVDEIKAP